MSKISKAFDQIHADQELIDSTKARLQAVRQERERATKKEPGRWPGKYRRRWVSALVTCAIAILIIGTCGYRTTVAAASYISIDAGPSIELTLNKWNKVTDAKAYNDCGIAVLSSVNVKGKSYQKAIDAIMKSSEMESSLAQDGGVTFTVCSPNQSKNSDIEQTISGCHSVKNHHGTTTAETEDLSEKAHKNGMTIGKYKMYLTLKEYDESITEEECQEMSAGEMESCICDHENGNEEEHGSEEGDHECEHDGDSEHEHGSGESEHDD